MQFIIYDQIELHMCMHSDRTKYVHTHILTRRHTTASDQVLHCLLTECTLKI